MTVFPPAVELPGDPAERMAVGFARVLRGLGVRVPTSSTINFAEAIGQVGMADRTAVFWAGRATMIQRPEDIAVYDTAFAIFWQQRHPENVRVDGEPPPVTLAVDDEEEDEPPGSDDDGESPGDIQALRFSRIEILTEKDFSECTDAELAELTQLMARLRFTNHTRRSRRQMPVKGRGDRLDLRRTVKRALRHHGEPHRWAHTSSATRPRRLVLLLDVSGSMEPYARALIRFLHAATASRGRVEAFTMGTRLTRITRHLASRDPDAALKRATPEVRDWAGGTRLGDGLAQFNDEWGIRGMARGSVVVILSDGWERGDAEELADQMERLHRVDPPTHLGQPVEGVARLRAAGGRDGGSPSPRRPVRSRQLVSIARTTGDDPGRSHRPGSQIMSSIPPPDIPPPTGPATTPGPWSAPTGPPAPPPGWQPGQPVVHPEMPTGRRWGMGDVALGAAFIAGAVVLATILGLVLAGVDAVESVADGDLEGTDVAVFLGIATFGQSLAMGSWPVIVARWKGNGVVEDFGLRFRPIDLAWGLGIGLVLLLIAGGLGIALTEGLGVGEEESTNTQIISDAADTSSMWVLVIAAVVVAPVVEELFFRGLCLRAIENRFGTTVGVIGSTLLFTVPHFTNPSLAGTAVLFTVIGVVGLGLGVLTVKTGRLGAAIIAHAGFNAVGVLGVLVG